jgi:hypothetical protein
MSEAGGQYRLDKIPTFDPQRQMQLVEFLGNPIDSYMPYQSPRKNCLRTDIQVPLIFQRDSRANPDYEKIWKERLARIQKSTPQNRPRRGRMSSLQYVYPSLVQRQNDIGIPDPFNRLQVEEIADRRGEVVHGPAQKLSELPVLRGAPRDLVWGVLRRKKSRTR